MIKRSRTRFLRPRFYSSAAFWSAKLFVQRLRFYWRRVLFQTAAQYVAARDGTRILGRFVLSAAIMILVAVASAAVLQWVIGPRFAALYSAVDPDAYSAVLQTVAGITGVFLALHFGGLTAVVSAHQDIGDDIRGLILEERVGNVYVRFLVYVTALALTLLAFRALGFQAHSVIVPALLVFAIPAMVAFTTLVRVHFAIMDAANLATLAHGRLQKAIDGVRIGQIGWQDRSFQTHHHRTASRIIEALGRLLRSAENRDAGAALSHCNRLVASTQIYLDKRSMIPPSSSWHESPHTYRMWHLSNYSRIEMADLTSTGLQPDSTPLHTWLEDRVFDLLMQFLQRRVVENDAGSLLNLMNSLSDLFKVTARENGIEYGVRRLRNLQEHVRSFVTSIDDTDTLAWALVERIAILPIETLLGFRALLERLGHTGLVAVSTAVSSAKAKTAFASKPHLWIAQNAEDTVKRLSFEAAVERSRITPDWFILHQLELAALHALHNDLKQLPALTAFFSDLATALRQAQRWRLASIVVDRGMECTNKIRSGLREAEALAASLLPDHNLDNYFLPVFDWASMHAEVTAAETTLQEELAQLIAGLVDDVPDPTKPDLLGQAVHRTGQAVFERLMNNDGQGFARLWKYFFYGCLKITEKLDSILHDSDAERRVLLGSEALFDLIAQSGFALGWAEFHQNPELAKPCVELWDKYFADKTDERLKFYAALLHAKRSGLKQTQGDTKRMSWLQAFENAIRDLPHVEHRERGAFGYSLRVLHPSALIRYMGQQPGSLSDGLEIFICRYLQTRQDTASLDFGREWLSKGMQRETELGPPSEASTDE